MSSCPQVAAQTTPINMTLVTAWPSDIKTATCGSPEHPYDLDGNMGPVRQAGYQHQPISCCPHFFRSASYHDTPTILPLLLSHFSTMYLLIIMASTTCLVSCSACPWISLVSPNHEDPGCPMGVFCLLEPHGLRAASGSTRSTFILCVLVFVYICL